MVRGADWAPVARPATSAPLNKVEQALGTAVPCAQRKRRRSERSTKTIDQTLIFAP
jgi:hypothetical protein